MRQRGLLTKKLELFYNEIQPKRKTKQNEVDQEFKKKKNDMKELNKKDNVEMFSTKIRGGKAFAVEHKIRELKKRISKLLLIKSKKEN